LFLSHVLIVEDDAGMRTLLERILRENGFRTTGAQNGREMWECINSKTVDLILLDLMLPGVSGLDLCRTLRNTAAVPIIIVSARGDEMDRVLGLELGADDYIAKPFGKRELLARVRAVLRRVSILTALPGHSTGEVLHFNGWSLDLRRRELIDTAGVAVELSGAELDLLVGFLENPQRIIGRERLLELARSRIGSVGDRSVDVLVSRLRRKMRSNGAEEDLIRTIRGIGYMFTADVERR
jgi:DNA-binding response OmpR family regulator